MPPPTATSTRKKVPSSSEKSRRPSYLSSKKSNWRAIEFGRPNERNATSARPPGRNCSATLAACCLVGSLANRSLSLGQAGAGERGTAAGQQPAGCPLAASVAACRDTRFSVRRRASGGEHVRRETPQARNAAGAKRRRRETPQALRARSGHPVEDLAD